MTPRKRSILLYLLRLLFTVGLLVPVFYFIDLPSVSEIVREIRWEYLFVLAILVVVIFLLQAVKTKFLLAQQGCDLSIFRLFCLSAIIALYNVMIPGVLSTGIKWYLLRKDTGKGAQVFSAMAYNQVSIMVVMMVFGLGALMVENSMLTQSTDPYVAYTLEIVSGALLALTVLASLLLLNRRTGGWFIGVCRRALQPLPTRIRTKAEGLLRQAATFQTVGWRFHLIVLVLTIVVNLGGSVSVYFVAARATNVMVPISALLWIAGVLYVLGRLPISIANLGIREVTLVAFLPLYGVDKSAALLMSIMVFLATIIRAILGFFCQLGWAARPLVETEPPAHET